MKTWWISLILLLAVEISFSANPKLPKLPVDVAKALRTPEKVTLYSLEPRQRAGPEGGPFYNYKVLGSIELDQSQKTAAVADVQSVIKNWNGWIAACFDPRHAIRVTSGKHTYDFILCFECNGLRIARDGKGLDSPGISGSPKVLNAILSGAGVKLSMTRAEEDEDARKKWHAGMPKSLRPIWTDAMWSEEPPNAEPFRGPIAKEFPDPRQRALVLFGWLASVMDALMVNRWHECLTRDLLMDIPLPDLVAAAEAENLSEAQLDGAARLFSGWYSRPEDLKALPAPLKKRLLDHCLKKSDEFMRRQATEVFSKP